MIGKILGNRYELLEKIGEGGMAYVYLAKDNILNRMVAVKILKEEFYSDEEFLKNFKNEAMAAASLNNPHIISVYDVGYDSEVYYIVMEHVDGIDIRQLVKKEGYLDEYSALDILKQTAEALAEAHRKKIIHRDIKSQNIMLTGEGMVKVGDFGIAKAVSSSTITVNEGVLGSVHYFSPEQARGGYMDERSDIYSLGIVFYEMLTGSVPFSGETPVNVALKHIHSKVELLPEDAERISEGAQSLLRKMTQRSADKRYASANDVIRDIDEIQRKGNISDNTSRYEEDFQTRKILFGKEFVEDFDFDEDIMDDRHMDIHKGDKTVKTKKAPAKKEKGSKKLAFLAILFALVASVTFLSFIFFSSGGFGGILGNVVAEKIEAPNLVDMTFEEAEAAAKALNLTIENAGEVVNNKYTPGHITEQVPAEGTKMEEGDSIKVTLAKAGQKKVSVPSVEGKNINDAETLLQDAGLFSTPKYEFSTDIEEDMVISQSITGGQEVSEGETIILIVSRGKEEVLQKVPDLLGKTMEQANGLKGSFKLEQSFNEDKNRPNGVILSQNPKGGNDAVEGSTITLVINRIEQPAEPEIKSEFVHIVLPEKDMVRVQLKDTSTGVFIFDKEVVPVDEGGILRISVMGKAGETKQIEIYIDSEFILTQAVSF